MNNVYPFNILSTATFVVDAMTSFHGNGTPGVQESFFSNNHTRNITTTDKRKLFPAPNTPEKQEIILYIIKLRNKSWKPDCFFLVLTWVGGYQYFIPNWRRGIKFTNIRQSMLKLKHILASINYFDSDMSNSTNTVVYFDWKTVIYIYACGQCHTKFMLSNSSRR